MNAKTPDAMPNPEERLQRFLAGEMAPAEARAFEDEILSSDVLAELVYEQQGMDVLIAAARADQDIMAFVTAPAVGPAPVPAWAPASVPAEKSAAKSAAGSAAEAADEITGTRRPDAWRSSGRSFWAQFRRTRVWVPVGAAVVVLAFVLGSWLPFITDGNQERMRGPAATPRLLAPLGPLRVLPDRFTWSRSQGAARYRLRLLDPSARLIHQITTTDTTVVIPPEVFQKIRPGNFAITWIVVPQDLKGADLRPSLPATIRLAPSTSP